MNESSDDTARARLVLALRRAGLADPRVLDAIERTPRDVFVPDMFKPQAWDDAALPIECGQTISQPFVVGAMTAALEPDARHKALEVGTGSGYQTAILARLVRRLYTIERYKTLSIAAEARIKALRITNVITRVGDGGLGWAQQGPFDRILVTAASPTRPDALLDQLAPGGVLVVPVGAGHVQELLRYRLRDDGVIEEEKLMDVRFVPLLPGIARDA